VRAAQVARTALGISGDAWQEAVQAMGERVAAITVAAILERVEQAQGAAGEGRAKPPELIRSPGGYLRRLSAQARDKGYSPAAFIMAVMATSARPL
jgi:replication initiation protein RepC